MDPIWRLLTGTVFHRNSHVNVCLLEQAVFPHKINEVIQYVLQAGYVFNHSDEQPAVNTRKIINGGM
jgi:hypothetical protein